jgi:hypothetical protein
MIMLSAAGSLLLSREGSGLRRPENPRHDVVQNLPDASVRGSLVGQSRPRGANIRRAGGLEHALGGGADT